MSANTKKLIKSLQKEHQYETENYQIDEGLQHYIKEQKLKVTESPNDVEVKIQKQITQNKYMEIILRANPPPMEEAPEEKEEEKQQQEEQNQQQSNYIEFQVNIVKKQNNTGLICFVTHMENQLQIQSVQFVSEFKENLDEKLYEGPDFQTLDPDLQNSFFEFLQSCGLTQEMVQFVETYSQDKEQRLYMDWLKNVEDFVSK